MKKYKLIIDMTCLSCETTIRGYFAEEAGVAEVDCDWKSGNCAVWIADGFEITGDDVVEMLDDIGFDAKVDIDGVGLDTESVKDVGDDVGDHVVDVDAKAEIPRDSNDAKITLDSNDAKITLDNNNIRDTNLDIKKKDYVDIDLDNDVELEIKDDQEEDPLLKGQDLELDEKNDRLDYTTSRFRLEGMSCASCVQKIQKYLDGRDDIYESGVNFPMKTVTITHSRVEDVDVDDITSHLKRLGFKMTLIDETAQIDPSEASDAAIREKKRKLLFCCIFSVPMFIIAMVFMWIEPIKMQFMTKIVNDFTYSSLVLGVLGTIVQFGPGWAFMKESWRGIRSGNINMSLLITIGTLTAYGYSLSAVISSLVAKGNTIGDSHFFETSSTLITMVLLGKYLEAKALAQTNNAVSALIKMKPTSATRLKKQDGNVVEEEVPVNEIQVGDVIKVVRSESIPLDGVILHGSSYIDESMISGESTPVSKSIGSSVYGGTILQEGTIRVEVSKIGTDTLLSQIIQLMERAGANKAPVQVYADKISSVFVPIVLGITLITFLTWFILVKTDQVPEEWFGNQSGELFSLLFAVSVVVIACPCALGLAVPVAVVVATGVAAKFGILMKGGEAIETAHETNVVVFDKTGTLTMGKLEVCAITLVKDDEKEEKSIDKGKNESISIEKLCMLVGSAELNSEHVIGKSIIKYVKENYANTDLIQPKESTSKSGRGVKCIVQDHTILIGNRKWLEIDNEIQLSVNMKKGLDESSKTGNTIISVCVDDGIFGIIELRDIIKRESKEALSILKKQGIDVWMVTGDNINCAEVVAEKVGIPKENVVAGVLPKQKYAKVKELQEQGNIVAFVGDGINDSPALVQANLGIAMGMGTDIALQAADVILLKDDLREIYTTIDLSRHAFKKIKFNFVWALGYNVLGILIASGLLYPFIKMRLNPEIAGLAMALSSVSVILSSLSLNRYKKYKFQGE